ncbi:Spy/CpxP family protein refolding chaperone [Ferrimonas aestuarii]|uniref:Protein CpxP n=1 Tax=Ferrimonas aestuarii TaxID=2569539 RepID=A0A4U1BM57_9GAMM|nr:Spy/CpxP family protein refolding chaperone [Ferrimonas aestuarii]TKB51768.1 hypothetical protein FCL42_17225 [Ferrimonas aestuarii]
MKFTKTLAAGVTVVALSLTAVGVANAQKDRNGYHDFERGCDSMMMHHKGGKSHKGLRHMFRGLDLTDEQKQQMKTIISEARNDRPEPNLELAQDQMMKRQQLMQSDTFNEASAKAIIEARQQKQAERMLKQMKVQHQLYQILTPEQQAELEQRQAEKLERMMSRF